MVVFLILSLITVAAAVGVVVSRSPIHSALWLVTSLLAVACFFAQLDAHFLAAVQVIVYAGAIMVLVVFVLMLLNLKVEHQSHFGLGYTVGVILAGVGFIAMFIPVAQGAFSVFPDPFAPVVEGTVKALGGVLYTKFIFTFEAASVLILAAIVGAVMLAKRKYREG